MTTDSSGGRTVERLRELQGLRDEGLITEDEFEEHRTRPGTPRARPNATTDWEARLSVVLSRGGRVVHESDTAVYVVTGQPVNHVLHLLLTVVTAGFWIFPWIIMVATRSEQRFTIQKK